MQKPKLRIKFLKDDNGATPIEYALIATFIGFGLVLGAKAIGNSVNQSFAETAKIINAVNKSVISDDVDIKITKSLDDTTEQKNQFILLKRCEDGKVVKNIKNCEPNK